jgi:hypothetical protein
VNNTSSGFEIQWSGPGIVSVTVQELIGGTWRNMPGFVLTVAKPIVIPHVGTYLSELRTIRLVGSPGHVISRMASFRRPRS